jgi:hypothetical protein
VKALAPGADVGGVHGAMRKPAGAAVIGTPSRSADFSLNQRVIERWENLFFPAFCGESHG